MHTFGQSKTANPAYATIASRTESVQHLRQRESDRMATRKSGIPFPIPHTPGFAESWHLRLPGESVTTSTIPTIQACFAYNYP